MLKSVIFDLDGVLLDNTQLIIEIFQEAAKRSGVKVPSRKKIIATLGLIGQDMIEILLGEGEGHKEILHQVWIEKEGEMKLMPGVEFVLKELKTKKAVVTSAPVSIAKRRLKDFINYFDVIVTSESTEKHKPNPEPLLLACEKLNVKPTEAVYIGDRLIDLETAQNAGTDFIGILSGGTSEGEFGKAGVKKIISSLSELLSIIK